MLIPLNPHESPVQRSTKDGAFQCDLKRSAAEHRRPGMGRWSKTPRNYSSWVCLKMVYIPKWLFQCGK